MGQSLAALSQATMRIIMDDKELRETAYHEAGHYVAKWALVGEAVYGDNLSIVPDNEKGTLGHCQPLEENIDSEESCRAYIISLYAGAAAQNCICSDAQLVRAGANSDDEMAEKYLSMQSESEAELREQTQQIIDANWLVVERIAKQLLKYRKLDADESRFLAENDIESLERYRQLKP